MTSASNLSRGMLRRHDLVFVSATGWRSLVAARDDLAAEPLLAAWVDRSLPLVVRRPLPEECDGVALGLPLPAALGKRRVSVLMRPADVLRTASPPELSTAIGAAPPDWRPTLGRIVRMAQRHCVRARVFGSLAWKAISGLEYLTASSDVDLLIPLRRGCDPISLAADIAAIEKGAPMRLDGEVVREDGAAVNWREFLRGHAEVIVKTRGDVRLVRADRFCEGFAL